MAYFDIKKIQNQFPILQRKIKDKRLAYLDNASTSQKPKCMIDAIKKFYKTTNANIHRGIHTLSEESTSAFENCRKTIKEFINANHNHEIIFTKNTTEAINLVAYTWGEKNVKKGDEIIVSELEHHSNLVPWQELCKRKKAKLKVIPITKNYLLDMDAYEKLLSKKTRLVAVTGMSNVTGTVVNAERIVKLAHKYGAKVLIDGAQSICHHGADVKKIGCDFFVFSAHKMLGPTGVGVLYGKTKILNEMPPFLFGGNMIKTVSQRKAEWAELPAKFEAGTPNIADIIAFQEAIKFIKKIGFTAIQKHDNELVKYTKKVFSKYEKVKLYCPDKNTAHAAILSFTTEGVHPHDIASIFDSEGVAIRSGHHCAEPLMKKLKIPATARMSFYIYNTKHDIDQAEKALKKTLKTFKL